MDTEIISAIGASGGGLLMQIIQEKWQGEILPRDKILLSILSNFIVAFLLFLLFQFDYTNTSWSDFLSIARNFVISYITNQVKHITTKDNNNGK